MPHVLVAGRIHEAGAQLLRNAPGLTLDFVDDVSVDSYAPFVGKADAILIRTQPMPASVIERVGRLKLVSRHGVGYDSVDVKALDARRIPLAVCGDVNSISVAEHTLMMVLTLAKQTMPMHAGTQAGEWAVRTRYGGIELHGRSILLMGFGRIGRHVARLALAFGMKVLAFDPYLAPEQIRAAGAEPVTELASVWPRVDVVSIHMPRDGDEPLIGAAELALMKTTALIVNTSRGGIVDEAALVEALNQKRIGGAGLDVFTSEPPIAGSPILSTERTVLSAHAAGLTGEAAMRMSVGAAQNVIDFFAGRLDPALIVNRASLETPATATTA